MPFTITLSQNETTKIGANPVDGEGSPAEIVNVAWSEVGAIVSLSDPSTLPYSPFTAIIVVHGVASGTTTVSIDADTGGSPAPDPIAHLGASFSVTVRDAVGFRFEFTRQEVGGSYPPILMSASDVLYVLVRPTVFGILAAIPIDSTGADVAGCGTINYVSGSSGEIINITQLGTTPVTAEIKGLFPGADTIQVSCLNVGGTAISSTLAGLAHGAVTFSFFE
jgi:hypothetical protein